jgi:glycosyltransferase involved in cell wall biosynthesis
MSSAEAGISVVILNAFCHAQGGASRVAIDSAVGLAGAGVAVTFMGAVGPICEELAQAPLKAICLNQRDLIDAQGSLRVIAQGLWNHEASIAIDRTLQNLDPRSTVVHLHNFSSVLSSSPVRRALRRGYKMICTLHDFFCACPAGAFYDFVSRQPCYRRALSLDCITTNCDKRHYAHKLYRVARSVVQTGVGKLPSGVGDFIGLSRRSVEIMRPYLPADAHIHMVPNPVNVARAAPTDPAGNGNIVAIGRLDEEKGIRVLLRAAQLTRTRITLIGDGPLRKEAEASGLCRVTGWISPAEIQQELDHARCLVFPSVWFETFGLVVDEAAARGVPAIASDISAAAERVVDGITGWHTRAGDAEDLARCLRLTQDDAAIRTAGAAAYARWWSDPPTLRRHVDRLTGIYREMLCRGEGKAT